jgi:NAD-dependent deacetylase
MLRPDVVWFGEMLPEQALQQAADASTSCDIFFSIGTSGVVQPAASLPHMAMQAGATLVVINPDVTPHVSQTTYYLQGPSGQVLPRLVAALTQ